MASFTTKYSSITFKLLNEVNVFVSKSKIIKCVALWDTGANSTCISHAIVDKLGLIPTGQVAISTPSGTSYANTYLVNIVLPNKVLVKDIRVCDSQIGKQGFHVLIGMDIITQGDFSVSNFGKTVFSFRAPSQETTDYVHQDRLKQIIGLKHGRSKK